VNAKSLDLKLQRIHANPKLSKDFILADAKDPDMALGIAAFLNFAMSSPRSLNKNL
jgi:hypothetical protein